MIDMSTDINQNGSQYRGYHVMPVEEFDNFFQKLLNSINEFMRENLKINLSNSHKITNVELIEPDRIIIDVQTPPESKDSDFIVYLNKSLKVIEVREFKPGQPEPKTIFP